MNSELFNYIGLGNFDIGYILICMVIMIIILLVLVILQLVSNSKLQKKYSKFMQGKDAKSLETDIISLFQENKFIKASADKNSKDIRLLYKKAEKSFQKLGLVKYDAFRHIGGKLSFSLALLDENNDGFIINSVHSTEGCYSYTKEIKQGNSSIILSEEESKALDIAMDIK